MSFPVILFWANQFWLPSDTAIMIVAVLATVACTLVGCLLVLRRMSLMGDAISHAVLPGLVLAYLVSGSLSSGWMFAGALLIGILTTWLIQVLQQLGGVTADSSMGIVFSAMFALGVVLLKVFTGGQVDLDVDCVLQGSLGSVNLDTIKIAGTEIPRSALVLGAVTMLNAMVLALFWKELKITAFDAEYATVLGFRPNGLHYLVMSLTALTAVAAFQAVGSILVIALLIVPAATAQLLTDRMSRVVLAALVVGLIGTCGGVLLGKISFWQNAEPAALIAVCLGVVFGVVVLAAPRYGIFSQWWQRANQTLLIQGQDLLAMFYRLQELAPTKRLGTGEVVQSIGGGWLARWALWQQMRQGNLQASSAGWELTTRGAKVAARLVRSHRLWEAWLVRYLGLPLDHLHAPAERMEHFIDDQLEEQLRAEFGHAPTDPHGREIPK